MKHLLLCTTVFLGLAAQPFAAVFPVTNLADTGEGSLRAALDAANTAAGPDEVSLAGLTGTITLLSPLPEVTGDTVVTGPGADVLTVSGDGLVRILTVATGATVEVSGLAFADGFAGTDGDGGAIFNQGTLTLENCSLSNNRTVGGSGGAIYNSGNLTLLACTLTGNSVQGIDGTDSDTSSSERAGGPGQGGAVHNSGGTVTIERSTLTGNTASGGKGGNGFYGGAGGAGQGGAVHNSADGQVSITESVLTQNTASGGEGGSESDWLGGRSIGGAGGAGQGGAIHNSGESVSIEDSSLIGNRASGGLGGTAYAAGLGGIAEGGAVGALGGLVDITNSALSQNTAYGGDSGWLYSGLGLGANAYGGAVAALGGDVDIANSTLSGNMAHGGNASGNEIESYGAEAYGGGLAKTGANVSFMNCTIVNNEVQGGFAYSYYGGLWEGEAFGGGIYTTATGPTIRNTIVGNNLPSDANGTVTSLGHNLFGSSAGVTGLDGSDLVDVSPLLGGLGDNGGPTMTHALLGGSPAINGGDDTDAPATDQRGEPRPQGSTVDIGAVEMPPLAILLDDMMVSLGPVTSDNAVTVNLAAGLSLGAIFYTLDGSPPTLASTPYTQPFQLTQSTTIRAVVYPADFSYSVEAGPVQVTITPRYTLGVETNGQGTVVLDPPDGPYLEGTVVTLTAAPTSGWAFTGWTGDATGTDNPLSVLMDSDKTIGAFFEPDPCDGDGDGLTNYQEVVVYATDPALADTDDDGLSDGYEAGVSRFALVTGGFTWGQAKADAEARGGYLGTFTSQQEWDIALTCLGPNALDGITGAWIGATDAAEEGTWTWITGEPFSFSQWADGQPDDYNNSDVAEVSGGFGAQLGKWYDTGTSVLRDGFLLETAYSTDPTVADTDGDGLNDGQELGIPGLSPLSPDSDGDGTDDAAEDADGDDLGNLAEIATHGTDPVNPDTDGDSYLDGYEIANGSDPNLAASVPLFALVLSVGGDGAGGSVSGTGSLAHGTTATLTATPDPGYVFTSWTSDASGNDNPLELVMDADKNICATFAPDLADDDSDGLTNYQESVVYGTDPDLADTDGDGLDDGYEVGVGRFRVVWGDFRWEEAKRDAKRWGGHLATFTDQEEWDAALAGLEEDPFPWCTGLWIGATDAAEEGVWQWITGEPFDFNLWAAGQPNNFPGEQDVAEVSGWWGAAPEEWLDTGAAAVREGYLLEVGWPTDPANADTDGDSYLDGAEAEFMGNPLSADIVPLINVRVVVDPAAGTTQFRFLAEQGGTYSIEASTNMEDWETMETGITGAGGTVWRDYPMEGLRMRYFRMRRE